MTTRGNNLTERALAIAALGGIVLSGEEPEVQGAALAEMMATFLIGHRMNGDQRGEREFREAVFQHWIETVRDLVLIHQPTSETTQ